MFLDLSFSTVPYTCESSCFTLPPLWSGFPLALWWFGGGRFVWEFKWTNNSFETEIR